MEDNFDPDVAFDDRPCTRLGNFEALENFHKALLEADDPLDVIELVNDNRHWIVAISPFGRRFCAYRERWLEVEEERENEEVEEQFCGNHHQHVEMVPKPRSTTVIK